MPYAAAGAAAMKILPSLIGGGKGGDKEGGKKGGGMMSGIMGGAKSGVQAPLSIATGLLQNIQAAKLKKSADSNMPPLIDPRQASFLAELNQKRKSIDTGADFATGMNSINDINAATNEAITRNTGGDVGGTIQALLQSGRSSADAKNNVIAQGQGQQMGYNSMFNELNNKISARSLQLQMYKSQQARAEWEKKKQIADQNLMAGVGQALTPGVQNSMGTPAQTPQAVPFDYKIAPDVNNITMDPNQTKGMPQVTPDASFLNNIGTEF